MEIPEQVDGEDGAAYGQGRVQHRVVQMPLRHEIFEAHEVENTADEHQPAGPGTAQPVIQYDDALPSDEDDQRDMQDDHE